MTESSSPKCPRPRVSLVGELAEQIDNAALLFVQCTLHADNVELVQRHIINAVFEQFYSTTMKKYCWGDISQEYDFVWFRVGLGFRESQKLALGNLL